MPHSCSKRSPADRGGLGQKREDPAAVVVHHDHGERHAGAGAGAEQGAGVVEEGQVADQGHGRPRVGQRPRRARWRPRRRCRWRPGWRAPRSPARGRRYHSRSRTGIDDERTAWRRGQAIAERAGHPRLGDLLVAGQHPVDGCLGRRLGRSPTTGPLAGRPVGRDRRGHGDGQGRRIAPTTHGSPPVRDRPRPRRVDHDLGRPPARARPASVDHPGRPRPAQAQDHVGTPAGDRWDPQQGVGGGHGQRRRGPGTPSGDRPAPATRGPRPAACTAPGSPAPAPATIRPRPPGAGQIGPPGRGTRRRRSRSRRRATGRRPARPRRQGGRPDPTSGSRNARLRWTGPGPAGPPSRPPPDRPAERPPGARRRPCRPPRARPPSAPPDRTGRPGRRSGGADAVQLGGPVGGDGDQGDAGVVGLHHGRDAARRRRSRWSSPPPPADPCRGRGRGRRSRPTARRAPRGAAAGRRPPGPGSSGVERDPGAITASVDPARTHSSTRVAAKAAWTLGRRSCQRIGRAVRGAGRPGSAPVTWSTASPRPAGRGCRSLDRLARLTPSPLSTRRATASSAAVGAGLWDGADLMARRRRAGRPTSAIPWVAGSACTWPCATPTWSSGWCSSARPPASTREQERADSAGGRRGAGRAGSRPRGWPPSSSGGCSGRSSPPCRPRRGRPRRPAARTPPPGLAASLRLAGTGTQEPLWDRLAGLDMPVLVVAGELDEAFAAAGRRLAAPSAPTPTLVLLPGAGHACHLERPDAVLPDPGRLPGRRLASQVRPAADGTRGRFPPASSSPKTRWSRPGRDEHLDQAAGPLAPPPPAGSGPRQRQGERGRGGPTAGTMAIRPHAPRRAASGSRCRAPGSPARRCARPGSACPATASPAMSRRLLTTSMATASRPTGTEASNARPVTWPPARRPSPPWPPARRTRTRTAHRSRSIRRAGGRRCRASRRRCDAAPTMSSSGPDRHREGQPAAAATAKAISGRPFHGGEARPGPRRPAAPARPGPRRCPRTPSL